MKILYIAYSCDPYNGSEDRIGWRVPLESARTNSVYVITKEEHRNAIQKYCNKFAISDIQFHFVDIPAIYKKVFRGFAYSGRLNVWNRYAVKVAKKLCDEEKIEIIHQITPVEFRALGDYGKIEGVKFVCGPMGGGEKIPYSLKSYAKKKWIIETVRNISNYWYRYKCFIKKKPCDYYMFANKETRDFLRQTGAPVTEIAIDVSEIIKEKSTADKKECVFLVAGRMIYRKGIDFLFDALERVPDYLEYKIRVVGKGTEMKNLQERCEHSCKLASHVELVGAVPYEKMEEEYLNADVLIMPSIRETTGSVLLEAMSRGLPVITIKGFGGAEIVDTETGWFYQGNKKEEILEALKGVMMECIQNPEEIKKRGEKARQKAKQYTWQNKNESYQKIYQKMLMH